MGFGFIYFNVLISVLLFFSLIILDNVIIFKFMYFFILEIGYLLCFVIESYIR